MEPPTGNRTGVVSSLKRLLATLLATAWIRMELLAVEVQEEGRHWIQTLLWTAALVALGTMTLGLITATLVLVLWEQHRVAALAGLSGIYLAGTLFAACRLRRRLRGWAAFPATINELKKDKACWEENNE